jgi:hypothetical protein
MRSRDAGWHITSVAFAEDGQLLASYYDEDVYCFALPGVAASAGGWWVVALGGCLAPAGGCGAPCAGWAWRQRLARLLQAPCL